MSHNNFVGLLSLLIVNLYLRSYTFCLNFIPIGSVADPYNFDTDPDPGCEKIRYGSGSGSRVNFDTDPDPGKNDPDPDPAKKA